MVYRNVFIEERTFKAIMRKILFLVLFLVLFVNISYAAMIFGDIYDISLDKVRDVIVEVDTVPKQIYIAKNGSYAFNVPIGDYTIKANYYLDNVLESFSMEEISVKDDGTYRLDLILFPSFEEEYKLLDETDFNVVNPFEEEKPIWPYVLMVVVLFLIVFYYWKKGKGKEKKKEDKLSLPQSDSEKKEEPKEEMFDVNQILKIIKEEGGRTTQKEIRKKIPLSEAKISLMIAELEHKGLIEKIKKGRGNILILKK